MDPSPLPKTPESQVPPPLPPTTSLPARLLNVFATPGEVFEEVAASPVRARNWLVPALIACAVAMVSVLVLFSQPVIQQKIREQQQAAMDKNVKAGKMTQAQADEALKVIEKFSGPVVMKIFGSVGAIVWTFAGLFLWAFGLWLLAGRLFKTEVNFMKAVEVASLAGMISVLHEIVTLLLRVNLGNPTSSTNLALLVGEVDPQNPLHLVLAMLDLFVIWYLVVLAVGFAKLTRLPLSRVLFALTFVWLVVRGFLILITVLWLKMFT